MEAQLITVFSGILTAVVTGVGGYLIKYINQKFTANQVESAKEFALDAVNHIEEIAPGLAIKGKAKFAKAIEAAKDLASNLNIDLTDEQWETFTNSALKQARTEWELAKGKSEDVPVVENVQDAPVVALDAAVAATSEPKSIVDVVSDTLNQVGEQAKTQAVNDLTAKITAVVQEAVQPVVTLPVS
ncbi:hypothetical protein DOT_3040 [Desulfosporosinus sp. OT]|nr:hypothetical protein DOT_3040 [Desulfosporosinus sp. OT]